MTYEDCGDDPVLLNHVQEANRVFEDDLDSLKTMLLRKYPSAESAIEDYRKGYLPEDHLRVRFTDEEIDHIRKEKDERDKEDRVTPFGFQ